MAKSINRLNFYDTYLNEIVSKVMELDILLKSGCKEINICQLTEVLGVSNAEAFQILGCESAEFLTVESAIKILNNGTSHFCRLYQREVQMGAPILHDYKGLAYIYDLDEENVKAIFERLNIRETTSFNFPKIFRLLPPKSSQN